MPRKYVDYSKTYVYRLTCKNPMISDAYISYTTNLTQRKYKHKREALDLSIQTRLYDSIRKNGGWMNWKCEILEECACNSELQAKERVLFYIFKMKSNLNDEKMAEKSIDEYSDLPSFPDFKPNIFADEMAVTVATPVFEAEIFGGAVNRTSSVAPPATKDGKYICLCKKSYAHRSSYYKHTSTCLQFQHNRSANPVNSVSVSIISTTTTMTTTRTTTTTSALPTSLVDKANTIDAEENKGNDSDNDNRIVRYRFKSKKNAVEMNQTNPEVFHYSNLSEPAELTMQISENSNINSDTDDSDSDATSHSSSSSRSNAIIRNNSDYDDNDDDDDDDVSEITGASDANSSVVSELLAEQNEKLKDYIRKMISALTIGKKRNKKSLVNSLVFELLDQNKTLQKQIVELSKERNIIVNNTNNNQFNLNFFLNEQCKDAVNLSDFVNSLEITMDDIFFI